jgi:hypothetical protein
MQQLALAHHDSCVSGGGAAVHQVLASWGECGVAQAELADPEKLKAREAKFGKVLIKPDSKNPKDPELMKKRAEKFKPQGTAAVTSKDDEARKKVC